MLDSVCTLVVFSNPPPPRPGAYSDADTIPVKRMSPPRISSPIQKLPNLYDSLAGVNRQIDHSFDQSDHAQQQVDLHEDNGEFDNDPGEFSNEDEVRWHNLSWYVGSTDVLVYYVSNRVRMKGTRTFPA